VEVPILKLTHLKPNELTLGRLVVALDTQTGAVMSGLRVISSLEPLNIAIATIAHQGHSSQSETIPTSKAIQKLRVPLFEKGDRVTLHGKKATVIHHSVNELFLTLTLDDDPAREILANLVHINADALIEEFDPESTQLYHR
jgi:hypothetical protein